jgi:hypothetical protein
MKTIETTLAIAFVCVLSTAACDDKKSTETDTAIDTVLDTSPDTAVDTVDDLPPDTVDDTSDDPVPDTIEDTASDPDVVDDTAGEPDAEMDAETDATEEPDVIGDTTTDDGGPMAYAHNIVIDGTNDFDATDEQFASSTSGYAAYVAWDDTYLYVGMLGADVGSASSTRWVLLYLGGSGGTTVGQTYNTQQPTLPFSAQYHVRWRCSNDYTNALEFGGSWADASWDFTDDVYLSGDFLEMRIPLADIGSPTTLDMTMFMINEAGGSEWSYAAVPSAAFADGYDPDLSSYYSFDIGGTHVPTAHSPI